MDATPIQRLASMALGGDVVAWVVARRNTPGQPSYQQIADELRAATGGQVTVTDQTVRLWYLKNKHGCCPHCEPPTWHGSDPCPNEAVAS